MTIVLSLETSTWLIAHKNLRCSGNLRSSRFVLSASNLSTSFITPWMLKQRSWISLVPMSMSLFALNSVQMFNDITDTYCTYFRNCSLNLMTYDGHFLIWLFNSKLGMSCWFPTGSQRISLIAMHVALCQWSLTAQKLTVYSSCMSQYLLFNTGTLALLYVVFCIVLH